MNLEKTKQHALYSWMFVGALVGLSALLGLLQYRWIGEVSVAERDRLQANLQNSLRHLSQQFNLQVTSAALAIMPSTANTDEPTEDEDFGQSFARWKEGGANTRLFKNLYVVSGEDSNYQIKRYNQQEGKFEVVSLPEGWQALDDYFNGRRDSQRDRGFGGGMRGMVSFSLPYVLELPNMPMPMPRMPGARRSNPNGTPPPGFAFGPGEMGGGPRGMGGGPGGMMGGGGPGPGGMMGGGPRRQKMRFLELDMDYVRGTVIPDLLRRNLWVSGTPDYEVKITLIENPAEVIYQSSQAKFDNSKIDGSVRLGEIQMEQLFRRQGMNRAQERDRDPMRPRRNRNPFNEGGPQFERGKWELSARHTSGSLETVVQKARIRNLAVTTGILLLMMAAVGALVVFIRRAQRLAELQMEFVAGVSHELRTPLSVLCTAGHNLRGPVSNDPSRVQRYGALIQSEGEKLTAIVEQVLRFASARGGHVIGKQEPVLIQSLVNEAVEASRGVLQSARASVSVDVPETLPEVMADPTAMKHVLQNLLSNAAKYAKEDAAIQVSARLNNSKLELRVKDNGQGIDPAEIGHIFDPFFRGKKAIADQIHGTGLGLSLSKRIVEAHRGTITVESEPGKGSEFTIRIPATQVEMKNAVETTIG